MGRLRLGFDGGGRRRGRGCGCGKQILLRRVGQGRKHRHHHGQAKHQCHQPFFHLQTHPSISARLPVDSRRNSVFSGNADSPHVDMLPHAKIDAFSVGQTQPTDGFSADMRGCETRALHNGRNFDYQFSACLYYKTTFHPCQPVFVKNMPFSQEYVNDSLI